MWSEFDPVDCLVLSLLSLVSVSIRIQIKKITNNKIENIIQEKKPLMEGPVKMGTTNQNLILTFLFVYFKS